MKRHPMPEVAEALRYLTSRGWNLNTIHKTAKESGLSAVQLADRLRGKNNDKKGY